MLTLSIIKADTGGFVGHSSMHPDMLAVARRAVEAVGRMHERWAPLSDAIPVARHG